MDSPEVRPPGFRAPRRVASAPVTPRPHTAENPPADDPVETLYYHPNVKIVAFTSSGKALLQNTDAAREEAGTLLARSPVERTLAVGKPPPLSPISRPQLSTAKTGYQLLYAYIEHPDRSHS